MLYLVTPWLHSLYKQYCCIDSNSGDISSNAIWDNVSNTYKLNVVTTITRSLITNLKS